MEAKDIIKELSSAITSRADILNIAVDRGFGDGMQIEKWVLIEMLAKLVQLQKQGLVEYAEGEHKYPLKTGRVYEHSDLWWRVNNQEHWLEVKTIVFCKDKQRGNL